MQSGLENINAFKVNSQEGGGSGFKVSCCGLRTAEWKRFPRGGQGMWVAVPLILSRTPPCPASLCATAAAGHRCGHPAACHRTGQTP